tara:strand:- start:4642 stop:4773 length:132 start_codon:yes stop_codon:yes gene_type:complete
MQALFGFLLISGTFFGLVIAALGHPKIYRAVFGGRKKSLDHCK